MKKNQKTVNSVNSYYPLPILELSIFADSTNYHFLVIYDTIGAKLHSFTKSNESANIA